MDITLIAIHKHSNEVLFAGANNSIYTISNGELTQIKGDKFPVGAFIEEKESLIIFLLSHLLINQI